jgi:hypothetical protein
MVSAIFIVCLSNHDENITKLTQETAKRAPTSLNGQTRGWKRKYKKVSGNIC